MKISYLVDTNVLVYAYDPTNADKRARASIVLERLGSSNQGAVSPQILGEFFVTITRKIPLPLTLEQAERSVTNYLRSWQVCDLNGWTVLEAIQGAQRNQMAYWDALIWATAKLHQLPVVLSEDFSDGLLIGGVRFINPFAEGFELRVTGEVW